MKKEVMLTLLVLILAGTSLSAFYMSTRQTDASGISESMGKKEPVELPDNQPDQSTAPEPKPPKIEKTKVSLAAIGDLLIHSSVYKDAKTAKGYNFKPMIDLVKPYIESADITFANQETMIGGTEIGLSTYPRFNSPYAVGDAFADAGVDIVSMANNHTLDHGKHAIRNAINHWDKLGVKHTGAYLSSEAARKITTIEKKGITFSFLAYTYGTNGIPVPDGKEYLVNYIDKRKMKRDLKKAKKVSDVVVVSLHYGSQYIRMPNEKQKKLVQFTVNQGADIILGHHPHVLQPVKWVKGKDGHRAFVAYSLGNFLSGQDELYRRIGGIAKIDIVKTTKGDKTTIRLKNPRFMPTFVYYHNWRNYEVYPLETVPHNKLHNADKLYKQMNLHMSKWIEDLKIIKVKNSA